MERNATMFYCFELFTVVAFIFFAQHFERMGTISSVLIARRRGESQGYGFVQFMRRADAQKALREMNESTLEDHTLQIKLSEKTLV